MTDRKCKTCGVLIPQERLEALPETETCIEHSNETAYVGFMVSNNSKGTAPELIRIKANRKESLRQAVRAHRRSR